MRWFGLGWLLASPVCAIALGCGEDPNPEDVGKSCVAGAQVECACPGNTTGKQVCNPDGHSFGPCTGCNAGSGGTGGSATGGSGGVAGSGGSAIGGSGGSTTGGSGGSATGGSGTGGSSYVLGDCVEAPMNDTEACDDQAWQVSSPGKPLVLVCLNAGGGTIYVAKNTGPQMSDGISRCQGWETTGQKAWDHLQYVQKMVCDAAQKTLDVDLSTYVGQTVYIGAHDNPAGGGHNTQSCLAPKK